MNGAILTLVLLAANPTSGCCVSTGATACEVASGGTVAGKLHRHAHYYKRMYYGHFDRHPFDYRFQFDYPWHAGPSQAQWPIPPQPAGALYPHSLGAAQSPRVSLIRQAEGPSETSKVHTSLKLRAIEPTVQRK